MLARLLLRPLPQWKALTRDQRKFVWREGVNPLLAGLPLIVTRNILYLCGLMLLLQLPLHGWRMFFYFGILTYFSHDLCEMIWVAMARHKIARYIHEHEEKIHSLP
jgi:biotin transporter BioY